MTQNVFLDRATRPTPELVAKSLKTRAKYWDDLRHHVPRPVVEEWRYYGRTLGWSLKLIAGKRNLCFLTACDGFFTAAFVFGDKAVAAARRSALPPELVRQLASARKYVEGRGIRIEVRSRRALEHAKILLDIKCAS
jgi:hypothetical protein